MEDKVIPMEVQRLHKMMEEGKKMLVAASLPKYVKFNM
jgi:hypothetical protein